MIVCGVDPGLHGALAWWQDGKIVGLEMLPLRKDATRQVVADVKALFHLINDGTEVPRSPNLIVVEKQAARPQDGKKGLVTLGRNYEAVLGAVHLLGLPHVIVDPKVWQAVVLKGQGDKGKAATIAWVKARHPYLDLRLPGKEEISDGKADAVGLAEYGARTLTGGVPT